MAEKPHVHAISQWGGARSLREPPPHPTGLATSQRLEDLCRRLRGVVALARRQLHQVCPSAVGGAHIGDAGGPQLGVSIFRPVAPKKEPCLRVPKKEPGLVTPKKEPTSCCMMAIPASSCNSTASEDGHRLQAALRAPDDPKDTLGLTKVLVDSTAEEQLRCPRRMRRPRNGGQTSTPAPRSRWTATRKSVARRAR
jgi:hypothetical protein